MIAHTELFTDAPQGAAITNPTVPKAVLIIAYAFPPEAYVGGRRTLKYCKYLGQFGWRPIVITIKPRGNAWQDEELGAQIPASVEVLRTADIDTSDWLECVARWKARLQRRWTSTAPAAAGGSSAPYNTGGLLTRVKEFVWRALLHSPDPHVLWVPLAFMRGLRVLLSRRVDVIYSSSPPHSSHVAASLLAFCFRKPHVIDLRDPWTGSDAVKRRIMQRASRVIVVSPGEPSELAASCQGIAQDRIHVITNGYDPDDFRRIDYAKPDGRHVTITHTGTVYRETGREFFTVLEALLTTRPGLSGLLRVNLLGYIDSAHADCVRRLQATGLVHAPGCVSHRETLECIARSDALLILARGGTSGRSHIPAKTFEYLYARKPILAIAEEGALAEILRNSGLGIVVPPGNIGALDRALLDLCDELRSGDLRIQANQRYINQFDRRILTGRFAAVLDDVVAGQRA